ncbi:MAG: HDOD domain-containing protein [Desulfobacteraceae bacterium]|jgi:putative nucleotidyltransferase with HDIG domain
MSSIETIVNDIDKLKPVPRVMHKIMAAVSDPNSSMNEISEIIKYDQALTATLLKVCNSSYYSLPGEVDSVHKAIMYLGLQQVVDIVLMGSSSDNFKKGQKGYDLEDGNLWKAAVTSALISQELAEKEGIENSHFLFTAALLKDIGKVILSQYVAEEFDKIKTLVSDKGYSFGEAEKKVLGIDHAQLGALVAKNWGFNSKMVDIIKHHHRPREAREAPHEASIIYMADILCMMMGMGIGADGLAYRFHKDVMSELKFTEKDFQEIIIESSEKIKKVDELLGG